MLFLSVASRLAPAARRRGARSAGTIRVTFVRPDGTEVKVAAPIGANMLEVAHANKIDIEGACGGETACSTCHVYVTAPPGAKLPPIEEAEEDMLDLAAGLADDSRLGCQVVAAAALDGLIVRMPKEVNNMMK